tara:strand:- start:294 stop:530 length:237 start_codon:yes stop_codon:yes gene_type:complete
MPHQIKKAETMIKRLNQILGVKDGDIKTTAEFYDDESQNGIWFTKRFHPLLEEAITWKLHSHGWSLEPYDSGTMHAYK